MTTIIYCHKTKQIAIDSRQTAGSDIVNNDYDKTRYKKADLWFLSGTIAEVDNFMNHEHKDKIDSPFNCRALFISNRKVYLAVNSDDHMLIEELGANCGLGSGAYWAESALDFGKSVREAVEYAATKDCNTGGKVRVFNLDQEEVL
ncbi:MAG TPA: hypothetical protein EYN54_10230 [Methylococcaceae bacterium]|nr:hypothetical protein [Methylococcaceae bacterium]